MRRAYLSLLPALLLVTLLSTSGRAQINLQQDFEGMNTLSYTSDPAPYTVGDDIWDIVASVESISPSTTGGTMFWGGQDLNNNNGGQSGKNTLTFPVSQICSVTNPAFSFEYNVLGFDGGDDFGYTLVLDGVAQPDVILIEGIDGGGTTSSGWETETVTIPEGTINVILEIFVIQNGALDYFGIDNVAFTGGGSQGGCGTVCGITNFGPALVTCLTESTDPSVDQFVFEIAYLGSDDNVTLLVEAGATTPANDVTSTTTIGGDDPTNQANGIITFASTAGEFEEGDEVRVTLSDGDNCSFVVNISTTENQCSNPCDINLDPNEVRFFCDGFTAGNDGGFAYFPFTGGPEPGYEFTITGGATISGIDPAVDEQGIIIVENIMEGATYQITYGGGPCPTVSAPIVIPSSLCVEPVIVINEVLADPGTTEPFNDTNGNETSNTDDEFVELYNISDETVDVSGYMLEDGFGARYTFPPGTSIPPRSAFVVIGNPAGNSLNCPTNSMVNGNGLGLTNGGDVVALRKPNQLIEHNMSYGSEGNDDQSLALSPDGDLGNGYTKHTLIPNPTGDPLTSSPCLENDAPQFALPLELLNFMATTTDKTVILSWATTNEIANDHFVVERSTSGRQWYQLGTVIASGQTAGEYDFLDEQPRNGENIYRLRQVDLDGSFAVFGPIVVEFTTEQLRAFPNPVRNTLRLHQVLAPTDKLEVIDNHGRRIQLPVNNDGQIDVSSLRAGLYLLRLERGAQDEVIRFVKQ